MPNLPEVRYDFDPPIRQGKTFRSAFRWADDNGAAIDLTGCTARMHVRPTIESPDEDILVELTTENDGITIDGENGRIELYIAASVTATFPIGTYRYDLEVVGPPAAPEADVSGPLYGKVKVTAEVTR